MADLSGLQLADGEVDGLRAGRKKIVEYINQLGELDTSGVEPAYQVTDLENVWREDEVKPKGSLGMSCLSWRLKTGQSSESAAGVVMSRISDFCGKKRSRKYQRGVATSARD